MGFFQGIKDALVTENVVLGGPGSIPTQILNYEPKVVIPSIEIKTENVITIDEIYDAAGILDKEKSIYKVEEIKNALPDNLPRDSKKNSAIAMMAITKLTGEEAIVDADNRSDILIEALTQFTEETNRIKTIAQEQIAKLEAEIDELKQKISSRSLSQEQQQDLISSELEKIKAIKEFIL